MKTIKLTKGPAKQFKIYLYFNFILNLKQEIKHTVNIGR